MTHRDGTVLTDQEIHRILTKIDPYMSRIMIRHILIPPNYIRCYNPEFPDLSRMSRMYSTVLASPSYANIRAILGSHRTSILYEFISGKNGVFRNIALGKRVNRSGRAVIVPDPVIPVNTIRLPAKIWDVMATEGEDEITVCINRQPSLSKYSILSFRAIRHTISDVIFINPCITPAFNADFDGDEMNVFLLDHASSRSEMKELISVDNNMISYESGRPIVYPVQDVITGCYLMTVRPVPVDRVEMDEAAMICGKDPSRYPMTSRGLLSMTLPSTLEYDERGIRIEHGILVHGTIRKGDLLDILRHVDTHVETLLQRVVCSWIFKHGLSATMGDCLDQRHHLLDMIESGSKGNMRNYQSITKRVGDQYVMGRIIGTCHASYLEGLSPDEYFIHQMAAREGVVNTGVNTASTGYLSRRGCKKMSEIVVSYDGTVVDGSKIVSFTL